MSAVPLPGTLIFPTVRPGEAIVERDVAMQMKVGTPVVREALIVLQGQGFVMHAGFPTVAAVYDRRFYGMLQGTTGGHRPPLQWKNGPEYLSELLTQDTSEASPQTKRRVSVDCCPVWQDSEAPLLS